MNRVISLVFFGTMISASVEAQVRLNKVLKNLHNEDAQYMDARFGALRFIDSNKVEVPEDRILVRSMDVNKLLKSAKRETVIRRLVGLLSDTTRDWYANLLLYDITHRDAIYYFGTPETRDSWVKSIRNKDIQYWNEYVRKEYGAK